MRKIGIILWVALIFLSCTSKKTETPVADFKPGFENVIDQYKIQLGVKSININGKLHKNEPFYLDTIQSTDSFNIVDVVIINPQKLSQEEANNNNLALEIASAVYTNLLNKNDFQKINIDFVYDGEYLSNGYFDVNHGFTFDDIEKKLVDHGQEINSINQADSIK